MVIDTFWYHHRDRLPDRSNPGIRNGDTGVLLSFPLFCQRDKNIDSKQDKNFEKYINELIDIILRGLK